jgi:hypothetical protein
MEAKMSKGEKRQDGEKQDSEKAAHKVTAAEREAIRKHLARLEATPPVRFTVPKEGSDLPIRIDHPDQPIGRALLSDALASADRDFVNGIVDQLGNTCRHGQAVDERGLNFKLAVIKGIEPRDQLETMLAAQMAAVHVASMTLAQQLADVEMIPELDSVGRAFNQLTRTFAMQMEALKRYRSGAEQKVTLQHVSVAEGGQAIVGNVTQAPREQRQEKTATPPTAARSETNVVQMPTLDENKEHDAVSMPRKSVG